MRGEVARRRVEEVVGAVAGDGLLGLLRVVTLPREVAVDEARSELVARDRLDRRPADVELPRMVVGRVLDCLRGDLRLEDRRHRLRVPGHPRPAPAELRRVVRRELDHRDVDAAALVKQLGAERLEEALDCVLCAAVGRLQRNPAVGKCGADEDDRAAIPRAHPTDGGHRAPNRAEIGHLGRTPVLVRLDFVQRREDRRHRIVDPDVDRPELGLGTVGSRVDSG